MHYNRTIERWSASSEQSEVTLAEPFKVFLELGWGDPDQEIDWHVDLAVSGGKLLSVRATLSGKNHASFIWDGGVYSEHLQGEEASLAFKSLTSSGRLRYAQAQGLARLAEGTDMELQKIAAVVTEYRKWSHAEHIVDRFLDGYGWEGRHHHPRMKLVSLYVDQVGANDLSRERAGRFPGMKIYPTIEDTLTLGGGNLAVDGVLLIGEHGNYPRNEKGQTLYPRYEFFKKIVQVFRDSRKTAPVFNDKHLSWNWTWAKEMVDTAKEMGFAFMAGSSVPVVWRLPELELPLGVEVEEALCIGVGGVQKAYRQNIRKPRSSC